MRKMETVLDINQIKKILPHRFPLLLVDKIIELEPMKYAVGVKFRNITDNHDLTDGQIDKIVEMLDEVSPKGVFKEFNEEIKNQLKK